MVPQSCAHPFARPSAALSRRALFGIAALGAAAAAGYGPHLAGATPATPVATAGDLVAGNTTFALHLYGALRKDAEGGSNLIFAPYSVSQALAMTYAGAKGPTAKQMEEMLAFTLPQPELHEVFGELTAVLVARGDAGTDAEPAWVGTNLVQQARSLRIANGLWGEQTYPFSGSYNQLLAKYYGAELHETDFLSAPDAATTEINDWVAAQTEDHIQGILSSDDITSDTRLVLANAIWFSGGWQRPFYPGETEDGDFFLPDGSTVTVPFMIQQEDHAFGRGDGFQVVELGYLGSEFAFTVILPDEGTFDAFEQRLDRTRFNEAINLAEQREVIVHVPKFTFESAIDLKPILQELGMTDACDPDLADFSGMVDGSPALALFVDMVTHKAFIGVDEEGTVAAAATVVSSAPGASPPEEAPPEIRIDRPFIFAIRDTVTGTLLFLGRVLDPTMR